MITSTTGIGVERFLELYGTYSRTLAWINNNSKRPDIWRINEAFLLKIARPLQEHFNQLPTSEQELIVKKLNPKPEPKEKQIALKSRRENGASPKEASADTYGENPFFSIFAYDFMESFFETLKRRNPYYLQAYDFLDRRCFMCRNAIGKNFDELTDADKYHLTACSTLIKEEDESV